MPAGRQALERERQLHSAAKLSLAAQADAAILRKTAETARQTELEYAVITARPHTNCRLTAYQ